MEVLKDTPRVNNETCQNEPSSLTLTENMTGRDRPVGFKTSDDIFGGLDANYVVQETAAQHVHSGSSALRLQDDSFGLGAVGFFEVERLQWDNLPTPYLFDDMPLAIEGYYKHTSGEPQTFPKDKCTSRGKLEKETTFFGGIPTYRDKPCAIPYRQ